jgi:xylan 1,4-beta-xylosidase
MSIPRGAEAAGRDWASRDWASRDWASRARRRTNAAGRSAAPPLAPPAGLRAVSGRGQVTLHWDPVPAAAGYLVHRSDQVNGPYLPLDHGGGDVLAVAGAPYADTEPLRVGGPGSAAAGWVEQLLRHVDASGAPLDFLSTHVYGTVPLDFRPALERHGRAGVPIWWTEWGTTPRHFDPVGDSVFAAAFLLRGMRSAAGRVDALSHWVVSDHFEELGSAEELFHGGFGLLSVGNLRKPRFWALALLARLGGAELELGISGDGAWSLVESVAASDSDGRIGVLAWNGTLNQHHAGADPRLGREVRIQVDTAPGTSYTVAHYRIDETHSNIVTIWNRLRGDSDWPDERQWELLAQANVLEELTPRISHCGDQGQLVLDVNLPMPGISYLELVPDGSGPGGNGPGGTGPGGTGPGGNGT